MYLCEKSQKQGCAAFYLSMFSSATCPAFLPLGLGHCIAFKKESRIGMAGLQDLKAKS